MNTNTNENNELTPLVSQPAATTRRGFIKRTAATALVSTFAMHSFGNEQQAEGEGGSSSVGYTIEYRGGATLNDDNSGGSEGGGPQIVAVTRDSINYEGGAEVGTKVVPLGTANGWKLNGTDITWKNGVKLEAVIKLSPVEGVTLKIGDRSTSWSFNAEVFVRVVSSDGTTLANSNSATSTLVYKLKDPKKSDAVNTGSMNLPVAGPSNVGYLPATSSTLLPSELTVLPKVEWKKNGFDINVTINDPRGGDSTFNGLSGYSIDIDLEVIKENAPKFRVTVNPPPTP